MFDGILGVIRPGGADIPKAWGSLLRISAFTTSGAQVWTKGPGTRKVLILALGAGGAGGSGSVSANGPAVSGSSGGLVIKALDVTAMSGLQVSVGTAGATGGTGNHPGGNGGNTAVKGFDGNTAAINIVAGGGVGGPSADVAGAGQAGGTASGGDVNIAGSPSFSVSSLNAPTNSLVGPNAPLGLGFGGAPVGLGGGAINGVAATGFGAAGSGAWASGSNQANGGAGAPGIVIIFEFA